MISQISLLLLLPLPSAWHSHFPQSFCNSWWTALSAFTCASSVSSSKDGQPESSFQHGNQLFCSKSSPKVLASAWKVLQDWLLLSGHSCPPALPFAHSPTRQALLLFLECTSHDPSSVSLHSLLPQPRVFFLEVLAWSLYSGLCAQGFPQGGPSLSPLAKHLLPISSS